MATVERAWQRPPIEPADDTEPQRLSKRGYEKELARLQLELVRLQEWIVHRGLKVVVVFEGRDTAGKGGAVKRGTQKKKPRRGGTPAPRPPAPRGGPPGDLPRPVG